MLNGETAGVWLHRQEAPRGLHTFPGGRGQAVAGGAHPNIAQPEEGGQPRFSPCDSWRERGAGFQARPGLSLLPPPAAELCRQACDPSPLPSRSVCWFSPAPRGTQASPAHGAGDVAPMALAETRVALLPLSPPHPTR